MKLESERKLVDTRRHCSIRKSGYQSPVLDDVLMPVCFSMLDLRFSSLGDSAISSTFFTNALVTVLIMYERPDFPIQTDIHIGASELTRHIRLHVTSNKLTCMKLQPFQTNLHLSMGVGGAIAHLD
jgi:hypothetical protein